ncbi:hypothetical protein [Thiomicrospira sp. ALE5]|uniref:hypothetical protein n=1 Tax=Thiomicrospira sp. ALE5 TaxID=748650 RepID=UPI0008F0160A|nr:hypothetical protein [Thiomicrospira sp. ALE5]SFR49912.1 hypothetical protein SAMN03092900_0259 [Thiomicrospira sp. ALE5]
MGTNITLSHVFEAMGIMLLGSVIAISIVTSVILGLYWFFKNDAREKERVESLSTKQSNNDDA